MQSNVKGIPAVVKPHSENFSKPIAEANGFNDYFHSVFSIDSGDSAFLASCDDAKMCTLVVNTCSQRCSDWMLINQLDLTAYLPVL